MEVNPLVGENEQLLIADEMLQFWPSTSFNYLTVLFSLQTLIVE